MKKNIFFIFSILVFSLNTTYIYADNTSNKSLLPARIGGWYPIFFNNFDKNQLDNIISNYKNGSINNIVLTYDTNQELANQISNYLTNNSNIEFQINQQKNIDTSETQYNHEQVILTIYNK